MIDLQELATAIGQLTLRFRVRRWAAAEWTSRNEVLLSAELGLETDTGRVKIGDGVTAWDDLPYSFESGAASGVSITAGEAIGAGKFAYIASDGKAYLAGYSSTDTAASLYVLDAIASGTSGSAYQDGTNTALSGLTPGAIYALGTSGGIALASTLTATSGTLLQMLGTATSTTSLAVSIQPAILRG